MATRAALRWIDFPVMNKSDCHFFKFFSFWPLPVQIIHFFRRTYILFWIAVTF